LDGHGVYSFVDDCGGHVLRSYSAGGNSYLVHPFYFTSIHSQTPFNKPLMGTLVIPGLSWGILLGALVIVSAWVLIYIYVRWANSNYDEKITQIMNK
jgi:uncharacterized membrane protein (DUF485 family)